MSGNNFRYDIIVIGGGAAGLASAVCCAKSLGGKLRVAVLEKEQKCGKKLLATGNGKCNLTNMNMSPQYYNENAREFVGSVLSKYTPEKIIAFWGTLGLLCRADSFGRVYPYSGMASSVLDVLMMNISRYNVDVFCDTEVTKICHCNNVYTVNTKSCSFTAVKIILATGGKVQPALGSNGSTYQFAADLKLRCSAVFPSLAPIPCRDKLLPHMKGVRIPSVVTLKADESIIHTEEGELQLNEKNISGICVFQLSRFVNEFLTIHSINGKKYKEIYITADLMPEYSVAEIERLLKTRRKQTPDAPANELFTGIVNRKVGLYLVLKNGLDATSEMYNISDNEISAFAHMVKDLRFIPSELSGINSAQVTSGGVKLCEIDRNMQCVRHGNLYIVGEALDVDGLCGGYNLHWAFASGIIAAKNAVKTFKAKASE